MMKLFRFHLIVLVISSSLWCVNLMRLVHCDWLPLYRDEVLYTLGVFTPTFYVTAWMDIK